MRWLDLWNNIVSLHTFSSVESTCFDFCFERNDFHEADIFLSAAVLQTHTLSNKWTCDLKTFFMLVVFLVFYCKPLRSSHEVAVFNHKSNFVSVQQCSVKSVIFLFFKSSKFVKKKFCYIGAFLLTLFLFELFLTCIFLFWTFPNVHFSYLHVLLLHNLHFLNVNGRNSTIFTSCFLFVCFFALDSGIGAASHLSLTKVVTVAAHLALCLQLPVKTDALLRSYTCLEGPQILQDRQTLTPGNTRP